MLFGLRKKREIVEEAKPEIRSLSDIFSDRPYMVSPKQFDNLVAHTRLPLRTWYVALWFLQENPEASPNRLASELKVSYNTGVSIKVKIARVLLEADHHTDSEQDTGSKGE